MLVVGVGNSGAEIAYELAESRRCLLAGTSNGEIPVPHGSRRSHVAFRAIRFFGHRVLRTDTRIGRKVGPKIAAKGPPLIRRKEADLAVAGIERVARVSGVRDGLPLLEDGRVLDVANGVRRRRTAGARPRRSRGRAGALLRRADLPVLADVGRASERRTRR